MCEVGGLGVSLYTLNPPPRKIGKDDINSTSPVLFGFPLKLTFLKSNNSSKGVKTTLLSEQG
jgi:hypothetical protein